MSTTRTARETFLCFWDNSHVPTNIPLVRTSSFFCSTKQKILRGATEGGPSCLVVLSTIQGINGFASRMVLHHEMSIFRGTALQKIKILREKFVIFHQITLSIFDASKNPKYLTNMTLFFKLQGVRNRKENTPKNFSYLLNPLAIPNYIHM